MMNSGRTQFSPDIETIEQLRKPTELVVSCSVGFLFLHILLSYITKQFMELVFERFSIIVLIFLLVIS